MKRFGYLYEKIYDMENLKLAHKKARRGKTHYKEVQMVDADTEKYLTDIHNILKDKTFKNSEYVIMEKKTDNGKVRKIFKLPYYPDRIIHHAIMQIIEPLWLSTFIRDTYSAIPGRGIHDGIKRIKKALRDKENTKYCLKIDVKKFYPSVDNEILKQIIRKKIKDNDLLWLLDEIIDSTKGIPIGNYLSQYFGNLYLSGLDHYLKENLNCKYSFRYCDDIVILNLCKDFLHKLKNTIIKYLAGLKLQLKDNWQVFPVAARGIDFLGYRFFHGYTLLRKSIKIKFVNKIVTINMNWERLRHTEIVNSVMSYCGWFKYANCKNLACKYLDDNLFWIVKHTCINNNISNPLQGLR